MSRQEMTAAGLLVWDFDGTLADTHEAILVSAEQALADRSLGPCDPAVVRGSIGLGLSTMFQRLVVGADRAVIDELVAAYRVEFSVRGPEFTTLFAGMGPLLDRCAGYGIPSAIATSKGRAGVEPLLSRLGVAGHFPVVVSDEDVTKPKPHPEMVHVACAKSGVSEARAIVIGDTVFDIEMGRRAGARTCAVTWGNQSADQLAGQQPDHLVRTVDDLAEVIDSFRASVVAWRGGDRI